MTTETIDRSLNWAYAYGRPKISADFRTEPEDFIVDEILGFELSGVGEHVYLHIQKRNNNTAWIVKLLARLADVKPMDIGYCGLKDRHAVTTQWFSVYLPKGSEPDWTDINDETISVLATTRHNKKLRRGSHLANRFQIRLRNMRGDLDALPERLNELLASGVPNYFGDQRFGRGAQNLTRVREVLIDRVKMKNRQLRGLIISSARSYLFNSVLSERLSAGTWQQVLPGEVVSDQGLATGPLWGRGRVSVTEEVASIEASVMAPFAEWRDGLEHVGLDQERRVLQLLPAAFSYEQIDTDLTLKFTLPPGTYATAVLREISQLNDCSVAT